MNELKPATANQMFLAKMAGMEVQTPKPVTVDQMFMQKIIDNGGTGGGGGVSSWNDLTDKPFYDEPAPAPIVWNNAEMMKVATLDILGGSTKFYMMCDYPIEAVYHRGMMCNVVGFGTICFKPLPLLTIEGKSYASTAIIDHPAIRWLGVVSVYQPLELDGITCPIGTYVFIDEGMGLIDGTEFILGEFVQPLDPKYLPSPQLLGEITVTNQNATLDEGGSLYVFNSALQMQAKSLFEAIESTNQLILGKVNIGTISSVGVVSYLVGSEAFGVDSHFSFGSGITLIDIYKNAMSADAMIFDAIAGDYPVTITVYAT